MKAPIFVNTTKIRSSTTTYFNHLIIFEANYLTDDEWNKYCNLILKFKFLGFSTDLYQENKIRIHYEGIIPSIEEVIKLIPIELTTHFK